MPTRRQTDHIGNRKFRIEISGVEEATFAECSGVEAAVEIIEYQDGDDGTVRKRPGRVTYSNLVLKRGYTNSSVLWDWMKLSLDGAPDRKACSIIMLDEARNEIGRYNCHEAWPVRWKGFEFDAAGLGASVEEIEIAVELVERAKG